MSIKINYSNKLSSKSSVNHVLFVEENFNISGLKNHISKNEFSYIHDLLKNSDLKKNLLFLRLILKKQYFYFLLKKI